MGANRRNKFGVSRRFAVRYDRANDPEYMVLVERYQTTKRYSQSGKAGDDDHKESVRALHHYHGKIAVESFRK
ncbi:hypothetical protein ACF1CY_003319 [Providencia rettgeri]